MMLANAALMPPHETEVDPAAQRRTRGRPRLHDRVGGDAHSRDPATAIYVLHCLATRTAYVGRASLRSAVVRYNADMREIDPSGRLDLHTSSLCRWLRTDPAMRRATSKGVMLTVFDRAAPPDCSRLAETVVEC